MDYLLKTEKGTVDAPLGSKAINCVTHKGKLMYAKDDLVVEPLVLA
jgi:hypothetical protein